LPRACVYVCVCVFRCEREERVMRDPEGGDVLSRNIFTGDISYLHATALLSRESPLEVRAAKPNCVARKHTHSYTQTEERERECVSE
jgi:hypothetical protein